MISREPILAALFKLLQGASAFQTASRRLRHWSDVPPPQQPALFLALRHEQVKMMPPGVPPVSLITCDVYVYANTGTTQADPLTAPSTVLNPLVDAIAAALAPDNLITNKQTLGGLAVHCWIEGRIDTDEGALGDQGVAIIPIVIKAA